MVSKLRLPGPYPAKSGKRANRRVDVVNITLVEANRCWFRLTFYGFAAGFPEMSGLTVNRFELRNRNHSTIPIIFCTLVALQKLEINLKILVYIDI